MKKILILLATICCCGCSYEKGNVTRSESHYTNVGYFTYVQYDGHEYLMWTNGGHQSGICHSPDCPCKMK